MADDGMELTDDDFSTFEPKELFGYSYGYKDGQAAARAELAAANTRADAAEAELEQAWETVKAGYADLGDSTERLTAIIDRLVRERNQERFARAALSARLERVRALAEKYEKDADAEDYGGELWSTTATALRAALGEDA